MMIYQDKVTVQTAGRGTVDVTDRVQEIVSASAVSAGICHLFIQHTSASLMLCENADPAVRADLETFMTRIAPDGDPQFSHDDEGPDDMPAHIRSVLTASSLSIPVAEGRCLLGTWQGVFLWEHRHRPHSRKIVVTVQS
ncbi:MAG: secondary thiamine-phosphate synthase enzyme YjbQ [Gammaproteobacteria bacterium]|nr:secondary thiamine-phosphate synthase enzyme YjbQ [Gammaproteobacteria bacterium]